MTHDQAVQAIRLDAIAATTFTAARALFAGCKVSADALRAIRAGTEAVSLYHFAKAAGVLNNNSAEDFAIAFYTAYNNQVAANTY